MKRVLVCALLMAWSGMSFAVVYKWVDAKGDVHYGDHPPDGVAAEVVEGLGAHSQRSTAPSPAAPTASAAPSRPAAKSPQDPNVQQSVDTDVQAAREKQCADAQQRYQQLINGRKIYTTGDDGQRQYLTSDQIDAARLAAKSDVDSLCNNAS
jgi:hypothetical protein